MSQMLATEAGSGPKIQLGRLDSISIYKVTESELSSLEAGRPTGYLFDLFLCLFFTLGISFIVTITTTSIKSDRLFSFSIVAIVSIICSLVCLCLWLRCRKSLKIVIDAIKNRVQQPQRSTSSDPTWKDYPALMLIPGWSAAGQLAQKHLA